MLSTVGYLFAGCIITFALNKQKTKQHNSKKQKNLANKQISQILVKVNVLLAEVNILVITWYLVTQKKKNVWSFINFSLSFHPFVFLYFIFSSLVLNYTELYAYLFKIHFLVEYFTLPE